MYTVKQNEKSGIEIREAKTIRKKKKRRRIREKFKPLPRLRERSDLPNSD
jgi:hypothetical protein